jgi:two-component system, NarL family, nitrate/nitrite response regulator NarL
MHPHFQQMDLISPAGPAPALGEGDASPEASVGLFPRRPDTRFPANGLQAGEQPGDDVVKSLSRREIVILRTLTEGASNKIIARKLVITESTVKVHMKAILRKLRLQNRTQAAIWARTHLGEIVGHAA